MLNFSAMANTLVQIWRWAIFSKQVL
jgi:hypothetical protein